MTPLELVKRMASMDFIDADEEPFTIDLLPPAGSAVIRKIEDSLPCPMPEEFRELLEYAGGFEGGPCDPVDFTGLGDFWVDGIFPGAVSFAGDGFGNYWIMDFMSGTTKPGPVYFVCHDPPVVVYQSRDLSGFLEEYIKAASLDDSNSIDYVHEAGSFTVWADNPGVITSQDAMDSGDPALREFSARLGDDYMISDMRNAKPGDGFSWGRNGLKADLSRFGELPIFAYWHPHQPGRKGFLKRIFGV